MLRLSLKCSKCGQKKPHKAKGMCKSCYHKMRNKDYKRPRPIITCQSCGKEKPHQAKGMCASCYQMTYKHIKITCSSCGKEKPHKAKGMCQRCYQKHSRPIITCSKCRKEKPHEAKGMCKSCYGRSPEWKNSYYLSRYGVNLEYINCLREQQNNQCAICGMEFDDSNQRTQVHVDHNHQTGQVRSLLCFRCNHRLAGDKDNDVDPNVLRRSADYLERWLQIVDLPQQ